MVTPSCDRIGEFECSDDLLNQLHRNVVWGTRGNFLDVPTDCPQRDERLGWTGDIAVFAPTAAYLFDVEDFLRDWLADLAAEQRAAERAWCPSSCRTCSSTSSGRGLPGPESTAIWSDAAVWVPWALWQAYGDLRGAARSVRLDGGARPARANHCSRPTGLWDTGFQFGDWLDPNAPPDEPISSKADNGVVATACLYRDAAFSPRPPACSDAARMPAHFAELAERTRTAFNDHYVNDDGTITATPHRLRARDRLRSARRRDSAAGRGAAGRARG